MPLPRSCCHARCTHGGLAALEWRTPSPWCISLSAGRASAPSPRRDQADPTSRRAFWRLTCEHGLVHRTDLVDRNEHGDRVAATAPIVRQEAVPERKCALCTRDLADGLQGS